ncbi:hypothetical protein ABIF02_009034 [Bradyrhizobium elkanii]|uniref:hypothetical protein n=1 Tax=Bradyrhizobium elkanii TaxID=29448 RepID=UPI003836C71E
MQTMVMMPRLRASASLAPKPILSMVSVTTDSGTSLIAPSNSRNRTTTPLMTRPVMRAGFETSVSTIVGMTGSVALGDALSSRRTAECGADNPDEDF